MISPCTLRRSLFQAMTLQFIIVNSLGADSDKFLDNKNFHHITNGVDHNNLLNDYPFLTCIPLLYLRRINILYSDCFRITNQLFSYFMSLDMLTKNMQWELIIRGYAYILIIENRRNDRKSIKSFFHGRKYHKNCK